MAAPETDGEYGEPGVSERTHEFEPLFVANEFFM